MKSKILTLLLTTMLLTGCGKSAEAIPGVDSLEENIVEESAIFIESDKSDEVEESKEAQTEEPYIFTFEASTIDGEALTSECFSQSKLTMLNVWATYCSPCLNEMPDLGEIAASYDSTEFQMIGIISDVAEDAEEETLTNAKDLIMQTSANYPHLLLNESLYNNLLGAVSAVPTTFFVNQEGEVLGYLVGAYSKADWEEIIDGLLSEQE